MKNDFLIAYKQSLTDCIKNDFQDNWDVRRFGAENNLLQKNIRRQLLESMKELLVFIGLRDPIKSYVSLLKPYIDQFLWIYQHLADDESRQLMVHVLSFRALGFRRVKLPTNNAHYWAAIDIAETLAQNSDSIDLGWKDHKAYKMNLSSIGYNITLFYVPFAIIYVFILHQYECSLGNNVIKAEKGDVVIDAGGCYGDTALYFAHEAGKKGKVYSFEFLPENLRIFEKNISLNPKLSKRINLIKAPLWSKSGEELFVIGHGPGTCVSPYTNRPDANRVITVTIDDLVRDQNIDRVDFIKMDIEGAELESLRGAKNTIRQFRPQLAISVYHKPNDFWEIPQYLDSLELGYKFALRHFTIHNEETVLFATIIK